MPYDKSSTRALVSDLKGKSVIVTAGAKGIGQAIVRRFASEGARVVFCDRFAPSSMRRSRRSAVSTC